MTYNEDGKVKKLMEQARENIMKTHKTAFMKFMTAFRIRNTNKPMTDDRNDFELGLSNPYSIVTCFVLYLYSMEFGKPNLYAELNRAARENDKSLLPTLGPFACALWAIITLAERNRLKHDSIKRGETYRQPTVKFNLAGLFLLFKAS